VRIEDVKFTVRYAEPETMWFRHTDRRIGWPQMVPNIIGETKRSWIATNGYHAWRYSKRDLERITVHEYDMEILRALDREAAPTPGGAA
jgi:hypothetical protein